MSWYLLSSKNSASGMPYFFLKYLVGLARLARHPVADDGVHRVVGAAAVHADPAQLLGLGPLGELAVRAGVLDHVADLVGGGHVPAEVVVAGVDDEDVALAHLDALFDHLAGVDVVVAAARRVRSTTAASCDQEVHVKLRRCPCPGVWKWISPSRCVPRWLEWVSTWPLAPLGASRLKYFICSGS